MGIIFWTMYIHYNICITNYSKIYNELYTLQARTRKLAEQKYSKEELREIERRRRAEEAEDRAEVLNDLRKISRQEYLKKREAAKLDEMKEALEDEKYLFQGVKMTEKERKELEYKEQVFKLAMERKKGLGEFIVIVLIVFIINFSSIIYLKNVIGFIHSLTYVVEYIADELEKDDAYHMPTAYDDEKNRDKRYEVLTARYRYVFSCLLTTNHTTVLSVYKFENNNNIQGS